MEDSFFVVEGILTVQLGDEVVELGPGDFATARPVSRTASPMCTQARLRAER
jgi:mannose-6-phosphate isomerase-like protein (cupin superfamily)